LTGKDFFSGIKKTPIPLNPRKHTNKDEEIKEKGII